MRVDICTPIWDNNHFMAYDCAAETVTIGFFKIKANMLVNKIPCLASVIIVNLQA